MTGQRPNLRKDACGPVWLGKDNQPMFRDLGNRNYSTGFLGKYMTIRYLDLWDNQVQWAACLRYSASYVVWRKHVCG